MQERLAQITADLPTWASPPWMMPPVSATSRIMKIGLSSDELNLVELSTIAYWKFNQRLMRVPGVAHVDIYGERLQQRHVQVDPARLARYGVPAAAGDGRHRGRRSTPACCSTPTVRWSAPAGSSRPADSG